MDGTGGVGLFYFKEKYEGSYLCMCFNDTILVDGENHISINCNSNDFTDIKYGYMKFDISSMFIDIKMDNGKIFFSSKTVISTDDLINDIIAMMIKKQMFRLKKYLEKD
jgi:hypothetical protein